MLSWLRIDPYARWIGAPAAGQAIVESATIRRQSRISNAFHPDTLREAGPNADRPR